MTNEQRQIIEQAFSHYLPGSRKSFVETTIRELEECGGRLAFGSVKELQELLSRRHEAKAAKFRADEAQRAALERQKEEQARRGSEALRVQELERRSAATRRQDGCPARPARVVVFRNTRDSDSWEGDDSDKDAYAMAQLVGFL